MVIRNREIRFLVLTSSDGFEVGAAGDLCTDEQGRMSAMASSLLSLSHAMTKETGLNSCEEVIIDGADGKVVVMSVPGQDPDLLLMAVTHSDIAVGKLLLELRTTCLEISRELQLKHEKNPSIVNSLQGINETSLSA